MLITVLLTLSTTHRPASDLGFLLHRHPDRVRRFEVAAGVAHVMYPDVGDDRRTAALMLEVDPVELVRSEAGGEEMVVRPFEGWRAGGEAWRSPA